MHKICTYSRGYVYCIINLLAITISGFTMVRNGAKYYYPIKQAISSILPIVDEFVVALGASDPDDRTLEEIESIGSDKIRIIHTVWDLDKYPRGMEHAHQTDIAKAACEGDWLFYAMDGCATFSQEKERFDYGDLSLLTVFKGTHPAVMRERMRLFNWADQLNYGRKLAHRPKHERMKYRVLTFIEQHLLGGRQIFSFRNYKVK